MKIPKKKDTISSITHRDTEAYGPPAERVAVSNSAVTHQTTVLFQPLYYVLIRILHRQHITRLQNTHVSS